MGCAIGLENSSNDNARGIVFRVNGLFGVGVSDAVPFAPVWAVDDGAELSAFGASEPSIVVWLLSTGVWGAVTGGVGVVKALMGLTGDTGLVTFVGLVIDFTQVLAVVTHDPKTCCPYGSGQKDVRL